MLAITSRCAISTIRKQCSCSSSSSVGIIQRGIVNSSSSNKNLRYLSTSYQNSSENNNGDDGIGNNPYIKGPKTHFGFEDVGIDEKEGRVKQVFENVADSYDVMNDFMSGGLHRYWKDQLLDMSAVASMASIIRKTQQQTQTQASENARLRILDVAGGTGDVSFRFLEAAGCIERARSSGEDPISVTVCDINPEMLRVGEARARKKYGSTLISESKALSFVEGNAQNLKDFEDNSFDLYTIAFGLRNVTDVVSKK
jgi:ubiquinone/menaquinone biosynthesis methyltransferase